MNTLSFKKVGFALVAGTLLVLPGCWRKKHAHHSKTVIKTNRQPDYMINDEEIMVYDDATEQLVKDDSTYLTANQNQEFNDLDTSGFLSLNEITQQDRSAVVYFDYAKAQLAQSEKDNLSEAVNTAKMLLQEGKKVVVKGHSCELGKKADDYNHPLSDKRAKVVANHLVHNGVPAESIVVLGVGAEEPTSFDRSNDAQAYNRRVEIYGINA